MILRVPGELEKTPRFCSIQSQLVRSELFLVLNRCEFHLKTGVEHARSTTSDSRASSDRAARSELIPKPILDLRRAFRRNVVRQLPLGP